MSAEGLLSRLITAAAATTVIYTAFGGSFSDVTAVFAMFAVVIWVQEEIIDFIKEAGEEDGEYGRHPHKRKSMGDAEKNRRDA